MGIRDSGTDLALYTMGVPFYSARGLDQQITPIRSVQGNRQNLRRTIGGSLVNITPPEFLKYSTRIRATDQRPPAVDGIWPGTAITVYCVAYLAYPVGGAAQRAEVSGSSFTEQGFVFYRPILSCLMVSFTIDEGEWTAQNRWELELEEV